MLALAGIEPYESAKYWKANAGGLAQAWTAPPILRPTAGRLEAVTSHQTNQ